MSRERGIPFDPFPNAKCAVERLGEGHANLVVITGVNGVGKDALVETMRRYIEPFEQVEDVRIGRMMGVQLGAPPDEIRNLPHEGFIEAHHLVAKEALQHQPAIITSHTIIRHGGVDLIDRDFFYILNPTHYVVLMGDPEKILKNRVRDNERGKRHRDVEDIPTIADKQSYTQGIVRRTAEVTKAGMSVIYMQYDTAGQLATPENLENAQFLAEIVRGIL